MKKVAIKSISFFDTYKPLDFKQTSLFFEKIFIPERLFPYITHFKTITKNLTSDQLSKLTENTREIEYLLDVGILAPVKSYFNETPQNELESKIHSEARNEEVLLTKKIFANGGITKDNNEKYSKLMCDINTRRNTINLFREGYKEVYPLLSDNSSYKFYKSVPNQKKTEVLQFVLNKIPTPTDNTPWEKIIDFRNDSEAKSKYLALICWINKIASSNTAINEIEDEYNYLYDRYKRSFEYHRIQTESSKWELLVFNGLDFLTSFDGTLSSGFGLIKKLFTIRKEQVSLLKEEQNLPGNEIAYIHKVQNEFRTV